MVLTASVGAYHLCMVFELQLGQSVPKPVALGDWHLYIVFRYSDPRKPKRLVW